MNLPIESGRSTAHPRTGKAPARNYAFCTNSAPKKDYRFNR